ncbi:BA75_05155T0 [Komagataella pastoris]|uniref:BA75_05155T0 n=1 Tax=Komagataella pastoris TaxID=4922 RepID=A0A1B2JIX0_PICPA|nr:BA75_05155T0 [Komagataella pastoris]
MSYSATLDSESAISIYRAPKATFAKRLVQIGCAMLWCLLAAGPIFGFAALKPVLIDQGIYHEKCKAEDLTFGKLDEMLQSTLSSKGEDPCPAQDLSLNFMFTLAAVVTNAAALLVGHVLDTYGPRVTGITGAVLIALASLLLRDGDKLPFDGYRYGYSLLALGGPFVFISCFQLANSFPRNSGLVLALLTGAFDTSSALFLFYRLIYQNDIIKNLTLHRFFSFYLVVPAFILICQLTIMPKDSYKTSNTLAKITVEGIDETGIPITIDESSQLLPRETISRRNSIRTIYEEEAENKLVKQTGIFGALHGKTVKQQIFTPWFYLMALFTSVQMLRINFFVATIRAQEQYFFDSKTAGVINQFFDIALPAGGIISIPFIGFFLDNFKTVTVIQLLLGISLLIGILGLIANEACALLGIMLLVVYRPFYYTAVSDFCAKVFGFDTFGTVYGTIICLSGFCNLIQKYLDTLMHDTFQMNPVPVNILLVSITALFGGLLVFFIIGQEKEIKKAQLVLEAENADVVDMPN